MLNSNSIKISIIVPIYNAKKTLKRCVDSILNQTYTNFELLLIDDGSIDGSGDICDILSQNDNRIRAFHIENSGVSNARNIGIENSIGDYICFVDSDDYVENMYLESFLSAKEKYPDIDNIWCAFYEISSKTDKKRINDFCSTNEEKYTVLKKSDFMTIHEKWLDPMPWNKLYNATIIKNNNLVMNKDLSLGEDLLFNLEYLMHTDNDNILIIDKPLVNYISDNVGSLDNKYYENILDIYSLINSSVKKCLDCWSVSNTEMEKYYNMVYFTYERTFNNTMSIYNKETFLSKIKHNSSIIRDCEFKKCIKLMGYKLPALKRLFYRINLYFPVYLYEYMKKKCFNFLSSNRS